jgi:3-hydroxyisobutyrate dehydrogenase
MKVAVLGTGLLGYPIARRLHEAGHRVTAWNRTPEKAEPLRAVGVEVVARPAQAVVSADVTLLVLADAVAIRSVLLAEDVAASLPGRTVVQMGTIGPAQSVAIQQAVQAAGGEYLEAPVLGSIAEANAGTLVVMVGGAPAQFSRLTDVLHVLSREPCLVGPVGKAAALKLALNQLIAAETAAFALSLGLIQRHGISVDLFMDILRKSALFAPTFDKKLPRLLASDYSNPNFSVAHLLKDVDLVLHEASVCRLEDRSLEGVRSLLAKAVRQGQSTYDYSALNEVVRSGKTVQ